MAIDPFNPLSVPSSGSTSPVGPVAGDSGSGEQSYIQALQDVQRQMDNLSAQQDIQNQRTRSAGQFVQADVSSRSQQIDTLTDRLSDIQSQIATAEKTGAAIPQRVVDLSDALNERLAQLQANQPQAALQPQSLRQTPTPTKTVPSAGSVPLPSAPRSNDATSAKLVAQRDSLLARIDTLRAQRLGTGAPTDAQTARQSQATLPQARTLPGAGQPTQEELSLQQSLQHLDSQLAASELISQRQNGEDEKVSNYSGTMMGRGVDTPKAIQNRIDRVKDALNKLGSGYEIAGDTEAMTQATQLRATLKGLLQRQERVNNGELVPSYIEAGVDPTEDPNSLDGLFARYQTNKTPEDDHVQELVSTYFKDTEDFTKSTPQTAAQTQKPAVTAADSEGLAGDLATEFLDVKPDAQDLSQDQRLRLNKWKQAANNQLSDKLSQGQDPDTAMGSARRDLERQLLKSDEGAAPVTRQVNTLMQQALQSGAITQDGMDRYNNMMDKMGAPYVNQIIGTTLQNPNAVTQDVVKQVFSEGMKYAKRVGDGQSVADANAAALAASARGDLGVPSRLDRRVRRMG